MQWIMPAPASTPIIPKSFLLKFFNFKSEIQIRMTNDTSVPLAFSRRRPGLIEEAKINIII
jgi:hypothetical protein